MKKNYKHPRFKAVVLMAMSDLLAGSPDAVMLQNASGNSGTSVNTPSTASFFSLEEGDGEFE